MAVGAPCVGTAFYASRVGKIESSSELNAVRRKMAKGLRSGAVTIAVAIAANAPLVLLRCLATVMNKGRVQRPSRLSRVRVEKVMAAWMFLALEDDPWMMHKSIF